MGATATIPDVAQVTPTTHKRQQLLDFIRVELADEPAVRAVVAVGSVATGYARPDSDIDTVVFLDPFDPYALPAEFVWRASERTFHSIFSAEAGIEDSVQLDCDRVNLAQWRDPAFDWPEGRRAELADGWIALDRDGEVTRLIGERTYYDDALRGAGLDEAITWLDQHLGEDGPWVRWESLGPAIAHDRLAAAYHYLVQALFAYNRRWRPWRNREMTALLNLPWLPDQFGERVLVTLNAPSLDLAGYQARAEMLRQLFSEVMTRLQREGDYGADPVSEAFIRSHEEPGRAWNMAEWNREHMARKHVAG